MREQIFGTAVRMPEGFAREKKRRICILFSGLPDNIRNSSAGRTVTDILKNQEKET